METMRKENKPEFSKYAIFQNGSKQYQAIEGKTVAIEKIEGEAGAIIEFAEVLFRKDMDGSFHVGTPFLTGAIKASIVKQMKGPKVIVFKFKRRKKVRVKRGHRQLITVIRIESI
ncbi:MAG TPA: 50S ribosomal protein L21 [Candidatus Babeliales bacterium]|nr:50S ribosomal protein L21 [Candidatus Babeliales bacterium]